MFSVGQFKTQVFLDLETIFIMKKRKKKISDKEKERRKRQAKMWHIATHPNEEFEKAERKRRLSLQENFSDEALSLLN